jgi:outer membrane murein-binding lipoprotein Lpp
MALRRDEDEGSKAVRRLEAEIDQLVFKLYGLSAEEIEAVEGASMAPKRVASIAKSKWLN